MLLARSLAVIINDLPRILRYPFVTKIHTERNGRFDRFPLILVHFRGGAGGGIGRREETTLSHDSTQHSTRLDSTRLDSRVNDEQIYVRKTHTRPMTRAYSIAYKVPNNDVEFPGNIYSI